MTSTRPAYTHPVAQQAHALSQVIDGHNDLAWSSRTVAGYTVEGLDGPEHPFRTDINLLRAGGVGAQFWSVYSRGGLAPSEAVQYTLEQIDFVHRLVRRYPDTFVLARTGTEIRTAWERGQIASLLGAEGGNSIGGSLAVLRVLAALGVKYLTLTHNHNTTWADSATDVRAHGGLTGFGREVVTEMNRLGVLADLSHGSFDTMRQTLDVSSAPVIFSHSSCHQVCPHPRNVPDDVLGRLSTNGGVLMVAFVPEFVSADYWDWHDGGKHGTRPPVTVDQVADHIEHAREVAGIDHVGLGSDYDGGGDFPDGMGDVGGFAVLIDRLAERRWNAPELAKLMGGNILRVLDDTAEATVTNA